MVSIYTVSEERCNEVESLVFDLFANLGATGILLEVFHGYGCLFYQLILLYDALYFSYFYMYL